MYTIIGGDGKEYGPVTAQQVRAWMAAGRANLDTQAKAAGTGEWKRLREYDDFSGREEPPVMEAGAPGGRVPAGRLARLAAVIIDGLLFLFCLMPLMNPNLTTLSSSNSYSLAFSDILNLTGNKHLLSDSLPVIILGAVQLVMLSTLGQSVGKRLARIRIVRFHDGSRAGFVHAFLLRSLLREAIGMIPWLGQVFLIVDILWIFRGDRRCLHDHIAGTVVVKATPVAVI
jgi:uncharacterized RDD family membrane protein YckC